IGVDGAEGTTADAAAVAAAPDSAAAFSPGGDAVCSASTCGSADVTDSIAASAFSAVADTLGRGSTAPPGCCVEALLLAPSLPPRGLVLGPERIASDCSAGIGEDPTGLVASGADDVSPPAATAVGMRLGTAGTSPAGTESDGAFAPL